MTKLEMLRYARKGIAAEMDREEEIIKIMKKKILDEKQSA